MRTDYPAAMLAAMQASIEDGALHQRPALDPQPGSPWARFVEVGLAVQDCAAAPQEREALLARLLPYRALIVGPLPPGLQSGMLPKLSPEQRRAYGHRALAQISDDELRQWLVDDAGLVYGEFTPQELQNYWQAVGPWVPPDAMMVDLGSGLGKVVLSAALELPLGQVHGVELLPYRHAMAQERRARMLATGAAIDSTQAAALGARIAFHQADFFKVDVRNAGLVFIYSTCIASLMDTLAAKLARELQQGALVTTTTFPLLHPAFRLLQHFPAGTLAWTGVFLYQRDGELEGMPAPTASVLYQPEEEAWRSAARAALELIKPS